MPTFRPHSKTRGMTMLEAIVAIAIMGIVALSLAALSTAVETTSEYTFGHGAAIQQARVALRRIQHKISTATATEDFPGCFVFSEFIGGADFPDTLVVWSPSSGAPANAGGPPLYSELLIYCADPAVPNEFVELRAATDMRSTPDFSDMSTWLTELAAIKADGAVARSVLIKTLRTAVPNNLAAERGVVRFTLRVLPSPTEWASYQAGNTTWDNLAWVQDIHGANFGLRQSWCQIELQLLADEVGTVDSSEQILPFFGSAALYYQLEK